MRSQLAEKALRVDARGFSLFELLVVLVLLGVIAGVVAPATGQFLKKLNFRQQIAEVLNTFHYARLMAVAKGKVVKVVFEEPDRLLITGGVSETRQLDFSEEVRVRFDPAAIVFYPEGHASYARIEFRQGARQNDFIVDPLTGFPVAEE